MDRLTGGWKTQNGTGIRFPVNDQFVDKLIDFYMALGGQVNNGNINVAELKSKIDGSAMMVFKNTYKERDNQPDYNLNIAPPMGQRQQPQQQTQRQPQQQSQRKFGYEPPRNQDDDIPF